MCGFGVTGDGTETIQFSGEGYKGFLGDFPLWVRLVRCGQSLETSLSKDGKVWQIISQDSTNIQSQTWLGFMVNSRVSEAQGSAVIDPISFIPGPAQPETVHTGILLKSGSFLAGDSFHLSAAGGGITHDGKDIPLKIDQVAAAVYHPVTLQQLNAVSDQQGMIMKNGDFLASDIQNVSANGGGGMAQVSSITLGLPQGSFELFPDTVADQAPWCMTFQHPPFSHFLLKGTANS